MKYLILMLSVLSTTAFSSEVGNFVGNYELLRPIKETPRSLKTRGSLCRQELQIKFTDDSSKLILIGNTRNPFGSTLNWIDLNEKENNVTVLTDTSLFQSRNGESELLGIKSKYSYETNLDLNNEYLRLTYQEKNESILLNKINVVNESDCLYKRK